MNTAVMVSSFWSAAKRSFDKRINFSFTFVASSSNAPGRPATEYGQGLSQKLVSNQKMTRLFMVKLLRYTPFQ